MAFKMKNAALKKQVEVAACPRAAAKMQAESAMKKMHSPAAKMETPAKAMDAPTKAMDAPTKAMTKSPAEFNASLRKAKAEGKLPKEFASVVKKKDDEMKKLREIKRNTDPNDLDAMEAINKRIRAHARKQGAKNVPDEETGGDRKPKKKAPLEMESPMKSEYGKRHDRLRKKGHKLQDKAMDVFDAGNEKKAGRLDKRAAKKFKKAGKIRSK